MLRSEHRCEGESGRLDCDGRGDESNAPQSPLKAPSSLLLVLLYDGCYEGAGQTSCRGGNATLPSQWTVGGIVSRAFFGEIGTCNDVDDVWLREGQDHATNYSVLLLVVVRDWNAGRAMLHSC
mgnify:CR=1 FL=1